MTAAEALEHIRKVGHGMETLNVIYILDEKGKLLEDVNALSLILTAPRRSRCLFAKIFWSVLVLAKTVNSKSLINEYSQEPAAKSSFVFEVRQFAGCSEPTIVYGEVGPFGTAEHATCDEVKQLATARKPFIKYVCPQFALDLDLCKFLSWIRSS